MGGAGPTIPELLLMDSLEALGERYRALFGRDPIQVSDWDASEAFLRQLASNLSIPTLGAPTPYRYSYDLGGRTALLEKLGYGGMPVSIMVTENGTAATLAAGNWLGLKGVREVTVLRPRYFALPHVLRRLGVRVREIDASGADAAQAIGQASEVEALWITHPIYNTGSCALADAAPALRSLLDGGAYVIADEVLAPLPSQLSRELGGHCRFVGIYAPHKSVSLNGLKFGAVVFHETEESAFEHWADILAGGLSLSSEAAVRHFVSPDFDRYREVFLQAAGLTAAWLASKVSSTKGAVLDPGDFGHFRTIRFPAIPADWGADPDWHWRLLEASGACMIPAARSGLPMACGYGFRVNLAQDSPQFRGALGRLLRRLAVDASRFDVDMA